MNLQTMRFPFLKPEKMSDKDLYGLCKEFGRKARLWRRKFAGLLPEVFRRGLYKRRRCGSIYEFAAKLAGMSKESVDKVLRISQKLEGKPALTEQLISGSQAWSKLEKVAYVATSKTDSYWAERVEDLPQPALEAFVQNYRLETTLQSKVEPEKHAESEQSASAVKYTERNACQSGSEADAPIKKTRVDFETAPHLARKFNQVKKRADFNEILEEFLKIVEAREELEKPEAMLTSSRPIPSEIDTFVRRRTSGLCAFPSCTKPGTSLHHTQRWALENVHDPNRLHLLCTDHERLAHRGYIENEDQSPENWRLREYPDPIGPKAYIDSLVNLHRSG